MSGFRNRLDILNRATREVDVRRHDQRRTIIDSPRDRLDGHVDAIGTFHDDQLDTLPGLRQPLIGDRREIERCDDDLGTAAVIE